MIHNFVSYTLPSPRGQHKADFDPLPGKMAVITTFYNPNGWERRNENYHRFADGIRESGGDLWTIEAAEINGIGFHLPNEPQTFKVYADGSLWQKERLLNILVDKLPQEFDKVAFVDADTIFDNPEWIQQTCEKLQAYPLVQLFERMIWLDKDGNPGGSNNCDSFIYRVKNGRMPTLAHGAPGLAWAARRELWTEQCGLYDRAILGSGDAILAYAIAGDFEFRRHAQIVNEGIARDARKWMRRIHRWTGGESDYVAGTVRHLWHGEKRERRYQDRYYRLIAHGFNFEKHIERDATRPLAWSSEASEGLRSTLRGYFRGRNEDGKNNSPLVSALMVTGRHPERRHYARQALRSLQSQSVSDWELIVVNDSGHAFFDGCGDDRVCEHMVEPGFTLGDLRNFSLAFASGEYMIQWDDDDFSGPERIEMQLEHSKDGSAVILQNEIICDLFSGEAYCVNASHWTKGGFPGTIMHRRTSGKSYPQMARGEDSVFLKSWPKVKAIDNSPSAYVRFHVPSSTSGEDHIMGNARRTGRPLTEPEQHYLSHVREFYIGPSSHCQMATARV